MKINKYIGIIASVILFLSVGANAQAAIINGSCGSLNGITLNKDFLLSFSSNSPKIEACASGQPINVQFWNGKYWWSCSGKNGGKTSNWCMATINLSAKDFKYFMEAEDDNYLSCYLESFITLLGGDQGFIIEAIIKGSYSEKINSDAFQDAEKKIEAYCDGLYESAIDSVKNVKIKATVSQMRVTAELYKIYHNQETYKGFIFDKEYIALNKVVENLIGTSSVTGNNGGIKLNSTMTKWCYGVNLLHGRKFCADSDGYAGESNSCSKENANCLPSVTSNPLVGASNTISTVSGCQSGYIFSPITGEPCTTAISGGNSNKEPSNLKTEISSTSNYSTPKKTVEKSTAKEDPVIKPLQHLSQLKPVLEGLGYTDKKILDEEARGLKKYGSFDSWAAALQRKDSLNQLEAAIRSYYYPVKAL